MWLGKKKILYAGGSYHMEQVLQTSVYQDGALVSTKFSKVKSSNGKGWSIMYNDKVMELAMKCTSAATLRVFMLLATQQQFEERGVITTKKAVQDKLHIDKSTCLNAFKWLKENFIINEYRVDNGYTEYMVNPEFVTVGKDKKKRMKEWLRRWQGQTVLTLPAASPPIGAIAEPKPEKIKPVKKKRGVFVSD